MNVKKQLPLTSIVRIDYDETVNPIGFKLVFKKTEMLLEASDQSTCKAWAKYIEKGEKKNPLNFIVVCICMNSEWRKWGLALPCKQFTSSILPDDSNSSAGAYMKDNQSMYV